MKFALDKRLSLHAIGMLARCEAIKRPISMRDMMTMFPKDKLKRLRRAVRELSALGYAELLPDRNLKTGALRGQCWKFSTTPRVPKGASPPRVPKGSISVTESAKNGASLKVPLGGPQQAELHGFTDFAKKTLP